MRLTVGPLPPAVYWRRRVIVLGVLLVLFFFTFYACNGESGTAGDRLDGVSGTSSAPSPPEPTGSAGSVMAATDDPATAPTDQLATSAAGMPPTGPCTDAELSVTPATEANKTQLRPGESIMIYLRIKNIGGRVCSRDIGADQQELRITQGAQTLWSSDHCDSGRGSAVTSLRPGQLVEGKVLWNGRSSTNCGNRTLPPPGTYLLFGRLGTKSSAPVALTVS